MTDDDGCSPENRRFAAWMQRLLRESAVKRLLAGNDTGCFTTEQYQRAYDAETAEVFKTGLVLPWPDGAAEKHLRSLADLIREVRPGVWSYLEVYR